MEGSQALHYEDLSVFELQVLLRPFCVFTLKVHVVLVLFLHDRLVNVISLRKFTLVEFIIVGRKDVNGVDQDQVIELANAPCTNPQEGRY